jgi:hypothetical protein
MMEIEIDARKDRQALGFHCCLRDFRPGPFLLLKPHPWPLAVGELDAQS